MSIVPAFLSFQNLTLAGLREIDSTYLLQLLNLGHLLGNNSASPQELAIFTDEGILVDANNFRSYLVSSIQKKLHRPQMAQLVRGFFSIVPSEIFSLFDIVELSHIIDGRYVLNPEKGKNFNEPGLR